MEILSVFLGSGGLLGVLVLFFWSGRWFGKLDHVLRGIDEKFKTMEEKMSDGFREINQRFEDVNKKLDCIGLEIRNLTSRMDRLEVRVEERTFRRYLSLIEPLESEEEMAGAK